MNKGFEETLDQTIAAAKRAAEVEYLIAELERIDSRRVEVVTRLQLIRGLNLADTEDSCQTTS